MSLGRASWRSATRAAVAVAVMGALAACPGPEDDAGTPYAGATGETPTVWFAARASSCDDVVAALERHGAQPGVVVPEAVRTLSSGAWCSVADASPRLRRADSWAQGVSAALNVPAISLFAWNGAWSYAAYDGGEPIVALESHYGPPVTVGDTARGAAALGLDPAALAAAERDARVADGDRALAARVGFTFPPPDFETRTLAVAAAPEEDEGPQRPPFEAGSWVAMPPLGVLLVKGTDTREIDGEPQPVYVIVDGAMTLTVPIAKARRMGMRRIATQKEADAVLALVGADADVDDAQRYRQERAREHLNALKRGDLLAIARAYSELCEIRNTRRLYAIEEGMLGTLGEWLTEELSTAMSSPPVEVGALLDEACD